MTFGGGRDIEMIWEELWGLEIVMISICSLVGMGWENGKGANGKSCDYVKILKRNKIVKNTIFKKAYHDL